MPNDQMPNYGVQTQCTFPVGLQARNVNKSEKNHNNGSYPLFIPKPVKFRQQRENKDETMRDKGREEKR